VVSALNSKLLRDLWHLRGQVLAITLVVMCGVASFVSMRSVYDSLKQAQSNYYERYRFAQVFANLKRAPEALVAKIRDIPGVQSVETRVVFEVTLDVPGLDEPAVGRLVAVPDRHLPLLNGVVLRQGRYVESGRDDEVLASEAFAQANRLALGDRLAAVINGKWRNLRIVGIALSPEYIYEVGGGSIFPDNRRFGVLWMARSALAAALNMQGAFNDVALALTHGASEAAVIQRLDLILERCGGVGAYGRTDQVSNRFISDEIGQNRVTSTYVPAIFFAVTIFLLHMVLTRLISMQRTEIGLLKAFGYSGRRVALHYLEFALLAVAAGVVLGIALGVYLGQWMTHLYLNYYRFSDLPYRVSGQVLASALLLSFGVACAGALSALRRVMRLPPAEAMRPEPPVSFKQGLLERLGWHRLLAASGRIVLRNVARRKWKALLSVLGIASAIGILVVGRFFFDTFDYMMWYQMELSKRDDVTVDLVNPRALGVRHEIARLPGVLRVEPFRQVPVRLRFEHRSRRVALWGFTPEATLRRLVDRRLNVIAPSEDGLILTSKLAQVLGVKTGELLTVEVMEGARRVKSVKVTGVVDEVVGLGAYARLSTLNQLLEEEQSMTGAYLKVDAASNAKLYAQLKRTPAVAAVTLRQAFWDSLNKMLEESIMLMSSINIVFACVIAFGVVYNSARIALSERGNELASLRVLGFSRGEVTTILLGEQGLLMLFAVPVGFLLGYAVCALLSYRLDTELYRMPLVLTRYTFGFAFVVVVVAALASGLLVARRIKKLDLIAVLKTRE
jgi:putative ABC transport system permease protein